MYGHRLCASYVSFSLLLIGSLIGVGQAAADSLTLAWDASAEPTMGYVVYEGTQSGSYSERIDVGGAATFTMTNAVAGQPYCFAVSAYYQSAPSAEGPKSGEACGFSNRFPSLSNPGTQTSTVGQSVTLQLVGLDPDGHPVSYTASGLPQGLSLMQGTGFISGAGTAAGSYPVQVSVSDGLLSDAQAFTWVMSAPQLPPSTFVLTSRLTVRSGWANIELIWNAVTGRRIQVCRDSVRIDVTRNDGSYTDLRRKSGSAQYQVCTEDTGLCSNTLVVSY